MFALFFLQWSANLHLWSYLASEVTEQLQLLLYCMMNMDVGCFVLVAWTLTPFLSVTKFILPHPSMQWIWKISLMNTLFSVHPLFEHPSSRIRGPLWLTRLAEGCCWWHHESRAPHASLDLWRSGLLLLFGIKILNSKQVQAWFQRTVLIWTNLFCLSSVMDSWYRHLHCTGQGKQVSDICSLF